MAASTDAPALRTSRRALVRSAAWSVPVVAVVATAPAYAASGTARLVPDPGTAVKWGKDAKDLWHISWDLTLTTGAKRVRTVTIVFTYIPTSGRSFDTFEARGFNPVDLGWKHTIEPVSVPGRYMVSAIHAAEIAALTTHQLHVDFAGLANNSAGTVEAGATITYTDSTSDTVTISPVSWSPGSQHTGH